MTAPLREGPHRGKIVDSGIQPPQPGKATCFTLKIEVTEWYGPNPLFGKETAADIQAGTKHPEFCWFSVEADNSEIVLYLYVTKKDGTINERQIEDLMKALTDSEGAPLWDGRSFSALHELDLYGTMVQFSCKLEEYNGKHTMRGSFLVPYETVPRAGLSKAAPDALKALDQQFGPKLRAVAPAAPVRTGAAPGRAAAPPPANRTPTQPPPPTSAGPATAETADEIPF